jgi:hypothetical protein
LGERQFQVRLSGRALSLSPMIWRAGAMPRRLEQRDVLLEWIHVFQVEREVAFVGFDGVGGVAAQLIEPRVAVPFLRGGGVGDERALSGLQRGERRLNIGEALRLRGGGHGHLRGNPRWS